MLNVYPHLPYVVGRAPQECNRLSLVHDKMRWTGMPSTQRIIRGDNGRNDTGIACIISVGEGPPYAV